MKIWVEFGSNQDENVENEKVCKKRKISATETEKSKQRQ